MACYVALCKLCLLRVNDAQLSPYACRRRCSIIVRLCQHTPTFFFSTRCLYPQKANPNQLVYKEPGVDLKKYHAVMLEPLLFAKREANGQTTDKQPIRDTHLGLLYIKTVTMLYTA